MELVDRYDALVDGVEELYEQGRYGEAVALMDSESGGLEAWQAELAHLKACVLGAGGDTDGALRVLRDASAEGAWWVPDILLDDDDLAGLRGRPEFDEMVAVSGARASGDPVPALVDVPEQLAGVVFALHGAGQTAEHARRDWAGVLERGYALVCVTSSHRMSPRYRTWPDREQAAADIAAALDRWQAMTSLQLPREGLPLVAAGFSAGGRAALDWALTGRPVPVDGVLAMAPALRELPTDRPSLSPATVWIGTDDGLLEVVDAAADQLDGFTIERVPGLGHAFPPDFAQRLAALL
ncbi:phospholipase [Kribbella sp. NPDC048915]|uniref:phospholipase n=1 Tax=Kribbella sp. NPDC048915 TaxID=3155148 RepID=UPI00340CADFE